MSWCGPTEAGSSGGASTANAGSRYGAPSVSTPPQRSTEASGSAAVVSAVVALVGKPEPEGVAKVVGAHPRRAAMGHQVRRVRAHQCIGLEVVAPCTGRSIVGRVRRIRHPGAPARRMEQGHRVTQLVCNTATLRLREADPIRDGRDARSLCSRVTGARKRSRHHPDPMAAAPLECPDCGCFAE